MDEKSKLKLSKTVAWSTKLLGSVLHTVLSLVTVPPLLCTESNPPSSLQIQSHTLCTALPQYPITTLFHNQNQQHF